MEIWFEFVEGIAAISPHTLTNLFESSIWLSDIMMLGHLGKGHLASGSLSLSIFHLALLVMDGALSSLDVLGGRSMGSKNTFETRLWAYASFLVLFSVATVFFVTFSPSPWYLTRLVETKNNHVGGKAALHLAVISPCLFLIAGQKVVLRYLQICRIYLPGPCILAVGLGVNIAANYVLMYASGLGFIGCAISTVICRCVILFLAILSLWIFSPNKMMWEEVTVIIRKLPRICCCCLASSPRNGAPPAGRVSVKRHQPGPPRTISHNVGTTRAVDSLQAGEEEEGHGIELTDGVRGDRLHSTLGRPPATVGGYVSRDGGSAGGSDIAAMDGEDDSAALLQRQPSEVSQADLIQQRNHFLAHPVTAMRTKVIRYLSLAIPEAFLMVLDCWILDATALFIVSMGTVPFDSHEIMLAFTSFVFMSFPYSIAIAGSIRIHHHLGANNSRLAKISAVLVFLLCVVFVGVGVGVVYLLSNYLGAAFTGDEDVKYRVIKLAPFVACFQVAYGLQKASQSILKATGNIGLLLRLSFFSMWVVGLPTGLYLLWGASPSFGLKGVWIGLVVGMSLQAITLILMLLCKNWDRDMIIARLRLKREQETLQAVADKVLSDRLSSSSSSSQVRRGSSERGEEEAEASGAVTKSRSNEDDNEDDDDEDISSANVKRKKAGLGKRMARHLLLFLLGIGDAKRELEELEEVDRAMKSLERDRLM